MKRLLSIYFLFNVFALKYWKNRVQEKICSKIYSKYGFYLTFDSFSFKKKSVHVRDVRIRLSSKAKVFTLSIDNLFLDYSFLKRNTKRDGNLIGEGIVVKVRNVDTGNSTVANKKNEKEVITSFGIDKLFYFVEMIPKNLLLTNVTFDYLGNSSSIKSLHRNINEISFIGVGCGSNHFHDFSGVLDVNAARIEFELNKKTSETIDVRFESGKVLCVKTAYIRLEINNSDSISYAHLNLKILFPKMLKAKKSNADCYKRLTLNIFFKSNNSCISVEKSSFIELDNIKFNFNGLFARENNKVIIKITSGSLFINRLLNEFGELKYFYLYQKYVSGNIKLNVTASIDLSNLISSHFKIRVKDELLINEAKLNVRYLSNDFTHKIIEDGHLLREIEISVKSPTYVSLRDVPSNLVNAVLLSEDGRFYKHNGFDQEEFGKSLIINIINRRFLRGGSTISMQLAKNLFLNGERTISRKLEEIFLTHLIENVCNLGKDRILELYLNIIEFGKDVYGISEAANYYFDKELKQISFQEALVLTYIIPRPKFFLDAVAINSPTLLENLKKHMDRVSKNMLKRKLITEELLEFDKRIVFSSRIGKTLNFYS